MSEMVGCIRTYRECASFVNDNMKDEEMRNFVFGAREVSFRALRGIGVLSKLVNAEFAVIYMKWVTLNRQTIRQFRSRHFLNVHYALVDLYQSVEFDLDEAIYVISEARKDVMALGDDSFFYDLIDGNTNCKFSKIFDLIYTWKKDYQVAEAQQDVLLSYLVLLLQTFRGVMTCSCAIENGKYVFSVADQILKPYDFMYTDDSGVTYLLVGQMALGNSVNSRYVSLDGLCNINVVRDNLSQI